MGKTYLRYVPSSIHGVIASPGSTIAVDPTHQLLFTPALENVGVWNIKRGVEVHSLSPSATYGDYSAKPEVTCLAAAPAGKLLAVGYADGMIRVFDYTRMVLAMVLNGHKKAVTALRFSFDGMLLASGSRDTDAIVWDLVAETGLCRLRSHKDEVTDLVFVRSAADEVNQHNILITSSKDTLIKVWDLSTLACVQTVVGTRVEIWSMLYCHESQRLLVSASDHLLRMWTVNFSSTSSVGSELGTEAAEILRPMGSVVRQTSERGAHLRSARSNGIIALQSAGKTIEVYRMRTAEESRKRVLRRLKRQREKLRQRERNVDDAAEAKAETPADDDIVLAGFSLHDIDVQIANMEKQESAVASPVAGQSRNFDTITTAGDQLELVGVVTASAKVTSFVFLDDKTPGSDSIKLAAALNNNQLEVFDMPLTKDAATALGSNAITTASGVSALQGQLTRSIAQQGHRSDIRCVVMSSDNSLILSTSQGSAKIWSAKTGSCIRTLDLGDDIIGLSGVFGPADRHAVVGTKDGQLLLFDLASGDLVEKHKAHEGALWSVAVRPDFRGICTGGADKEAKFWDFELKPAEDKTQQLSLVHARTLKLGDEILCVKYSHHKDPAKILVAVSLLDATVKVFFDDSLRFFLSLYGHKLPVMAMDISADSTLIVTASADKNIKIWGLDFGDCHKSFFAHSDSIMAVCFVANTHYFFSGSKDRSIKYYDGDRFENILTLEGHKGEVWGLATSSDGTFIVSCSHDRSVRMWRRTEEQVFIDEEREREMDAIVDKDIRENDGDQVLEASDAIGPLQADGTAKVIDMDTPASATALNGMGGPDASAIVAHSTKDTLKGSDRLTEALVLAMEETEKWQEYAEDVAAALAAGDSPGSVEMPSRNPLLLNLTPANYILRTLRSIRPSDIDQVLLVLPFGDAIRLLRYLHHLMRRSQAVELCTKACLLILRVHQQQVVANHTLLPLISSLRQSMQTCVEMHKDHIGYNVAGLRYLQKLLLDMTAGDTMEEVIVGTGGKAVRAGKRRAVIF